jgi:hypothetical protein
METHVRSPVVARPKHPTARPYAGKAGPGDEQVSDHDETHRKPPATALSQPGAPCRGASFSSESDSVGPPTLQSSPPVAQAGGCTSIRDRNRTAQCRPKSTRPVQHHGQASTATDAPPAATVVPPSRAHPRRRHSTASVSLSPASGPTITTSDGKCQLYWLVRVSSSVLARG